MTAKSFADSNVVLYTIGKDAHRAARRIGLGSLLAEIGREHGGVELVIERDRIPANRRALNPSIPSRPDELTPAPR